MSTSIEGLSAEHYAELSVASAISDAVIRAHRNGERHRTPGRVQMARQGSRPWKHRSGGSARFTLIGTYPSRTSTIILIDSIRENVLANELRVSPAILQSGNLRTLAQRVSETGRRDTPPDKPDIRQWNLCRRAGEIRRSKTKRINVQGQSIAILTGSDDDYISLTDIARVKDVERTDYIIQNWLRNRNTIEYLGVWEQLNNPGSNPIEFDGIRNPAGLNSFVLTTKRWIERAGAVGLKSKAGR